MAEMEVNWRDLNLLWRRNLQWRTGLASGAQGEVSTADQPMNRFVRCASWPAMKGLEPDRREMNTKIR